MKIFYGRDFIEHPCTTRTQHCARAIWFNTSLHVYWYLQHAAVNDTKPHGHRHLSSRAASETFAALPLLPTHSDHLLMARHILSSKAAPTLVLNMGSFPKGQEAPPHLGTHLWWGALTPVLCPTADPYLHRCLLLLEENSSTHEEALCKPDFFQDHLVNAISSWELPAWPVPRPYLSNCNEEPAKSQGRRAAGSSVLSLHSNASTFHHSSADKATRPTGTVTVVPSATSSWKLLSTSVRYSWECPQMLLGQQKVHLPLPPTREQLTEPQEELPLILKIHRSILALSFSIKVEIMY